MDINLGLTKSKKALRTTVKPIRDEILRGMKKNREIFGSPKAAPNIYHKVQKLLRQPEDGPEESYQIQKQEQI